MSESPPLILLPGTLCDDTLWQPVLAHAPQLAARARCVPLSGRTVDAAIAALLAQLPARFALAGFSLGGIIALALAYRAPERLTGLALIAANARAVPPEQITTRRQVVQAARTLGLDAHVRRNLWPTYVAPDRRDDAALFATILAMAQTLGVETYADQVELALSRPDARALLPRITTPALVVGGQHDALNPPPLQHELAQGLPNARLTLLDSGHFVPLEAPAPLARGLLAWLDDTSAVTSDHGCCGRPGR